MIDFAKKPQQALVIEEARIECVWRSEPGTESRSTTYGALSALTCTTERNAGLSDCQQSRSTIYLTHDVEPRSDFILSSEINAYQNK